MRLVDRNDIEGWAERFDSKGNLPILISRLIWATTPNSTYVDFPSGSASFIGGLDGIVTCQDDTGFVPKGLSLWELGTESDVKGKADDDYDKRTADPLGHDPSQATFIFVTPRFWKLKEKWRLSRLKEGKWKDIKVYDSSVLEQWLDIAGAVSRWFSGYLPKYPSDGIITIEEFWKEWAVGPLGTLPPNLVTAGREIESAQILNFLNNPPNIKGVQATSKDEAVAFIIASAKQFEKQQHEKFCSKSLIIDTSANFRSVRINTRALNLIARFDEPQVLFAAAADGHHVLVPLGPDDTFNQEIITLPTISRNGQIEALKEMGLSEDDAEKYSKESARNVTILKRLLRFPQNKMEWLKSDAVREIIPVMLLGRWSEKKKGDIQLIERLSGERYDDYLVKLNKWKGVEEAPIIQIGEMWRLTSPLDAWTNLSAFLQKTDLEKLKECFILAFKNGNPLAEPSDDSEKVMFAFNKERVFSTWAREGLTQSMILIGAYGESLKLPNITTPQLWVDHIVQSLLLKASGDLWVSLDHELPLISEASPDSFIEALYEALSNDADAINAMFIEEDSFLHKTSHHTGLLWALEGLAWMPEYLNDASLLLSKLSVIDPGGNLSNRPFNSLVEIFKPWHYQTLAEIDQQKMALSQIATKETDIAWKLIIKLLPDYHAIAMPTHKMRWRTFDKNFNIRYIYEEIWDTHAFLIDTLISLFDGTDEKLAVLLDKSVDLNAKDRSKILDLANKVYSNINPLEHKSWHEIRTILAHHRSHPDTDWALPEAELIKYEELYNKLTPTDTLQKNIWLFNDNWPEFPEGNRHEKGNPDNYTDQQEKIDSKRREAVKSILAEYGLDKLIELSRTVKESWTFGLTTGKLINNDEEILAVIKKIDFSNDRELRFAHSFILSASMDKPVRWIAGIYKNLAEAGFSNATLAQIFIPLNPSDELWSIIDDTNQEIRKEYWIKVQPWFYRLSTEEKIAGISHLLDFQRYYSAIDTISHFTDEIPTNLMVEALIGAATKEASESVWFKNYEIGSLFNALDKKQDIDHSTIIQLEWLYMPVLSGYGAERTPKNLHEELAKNPQFFVEVLKWLYMPKNRNLIESERKGIADEIVKRRAEQAYNLLNSWKTIPGVDENGNIDVDHLNNWITVARSLASEADRIEVADIQIGRILAQFPEKDLTWPPDPISEIIEAVNTDSLKTNFSAAVFNKRGSSSRGPFDGGNIERAHAEYFKKLSAYHKNKHRQLATIFNKLSKGYLEQAKQMDIMAERDRLEY